MPRRTPSHLNSVYLDSVESAVATCFLCPRGAGGKTQRGQHSVHSKAATNRMEFRHIHASSHSRRRQACIQASAHQSGSLVDAECDQGEKAEKSGVQKCQLLQGNVDDLSAVQQKHGRRSKTTSSLLNATNCNLKAPKLSIASPIQACRNARSSVHCCIASLQRRADPRIAPRVSSAFRLADDTSSNWYKAATRPSNLNLVGIPSLHWHSPGNEAVNAFGKSAISSADRLSNPSPFHGLFQGFSEGHTREARGKPTSEKTREGTQFFSLYRKQQNPGTDKKNYPGPFIVTNSRMRSNHHGLAESRLSQKHHC
ncbi:unnamed protein product [Trichogramma brassicae]|uniref:Uncharacterized protein n=1 Tax=Trichogramma brassicae TaxID=86971 RepID=A0A6H5HY82_9HYME|nr:unnamed protein product [Trichogramma brassicae]